MKSTQQTDMLVNQMVDELKKGITLEEDMRHFLESTFSITTPEELQLFLDDKENTDREMLFELLFFPDRQVKLALEPVFTENNFDASAETATVEALCGQAIESQIALSPDQPAVSVDLSHDCLELFVKRFNMKSNPPEAIAKAAQSNLKGERGNLFLVLLRGEKMVWNDDTTGFMEKLVKGLSSRKDDLETYLVTAIITMSSYKGGHTLLDHFLAIRQNMEAHAEKAHQFEEGLKTLTMESMMMQGIIGPSHSEAELRHKIEVLNILIMKGFGVDPTLLDPVQVDLGAFSGGDGVTGMFKALS